MVDQDALVKESERIVVGIKRLGEKLRYIVITGHEAGLPILAVRQDSVLSAEDLVSEDQPVKVSALPEGEVKDRLMEIARQKTKILADAEAIAAAHRTLELSGPIQVLSVERGNERIVAVRGAGKFRDCIFIACFLKIRE